MGEGVPLKRAASEPWFVYIARCADGTLYTGIAKDVVARIAAHDAGKGARYTRGRGPLRVEAVRKCAEKGDALRLELAVKRLTRAEKEALTVGRRLASFARRLAPTDRIELDRVSDRRARPP
jgi:putative endonuclease